MFPLPESDIFEELGDEGFKFACHPEVPCFNQCCRGLRLYLTPYDVLRLKNRLGITSEEFHDRYSIIKPGQNGWPMPLLKMTDTHERTCHFVSEQGCTVYQDRPGACRTYPLGRGAKGGSGGGAAEEMFFLVREKHCRGFEEGRQWTPETWTADQGLEEYNRVNDLFLPLITRAPKLVPPQAARKMAEMFFMAAYNLDLFRKFVEKSGILERFAVPAERVELMLADELELMKFGFDWLGFSLFGDDTLKPARGL